MKKTFLISLMLCLSFLGSAQNKKDFWQLNDRGGITWTFDNRSHNDHIEMAGKRMAVVLRYGIQGGNFVCNRGMVWPMLRNGKVVATQSGKETMGFKL